MKEDLKEIKRLLKDLRDRDWTKNHEERLDRVEKKLDLLQGNQEEDRKRIKAMERYLKVTFIREDKYKKNG